MDITITPNRTAGCRKPNFTAQLRGSAIREAIKSAKDSFQLGEVKEIIYRAIKRFCNQRSD